MSEALETNAFDAEELNFDDFQLEDFEAEDTLQQEPALRNVTLAFSKAFLSQSRLKLRVRRSHLGT